MPLFKEGRYGELGNWGKHRRIRLPSRKISALVVILLIIGAIFVGSRPSGIIPYVFGDYNTSFSHTRTPIFTDTNFVSPFGNTYIGYPNSAASGACGGGCIVSGGGSAMFGAVGETIKAPFTGQLISFSFYQGSPINVVTSVLVSTFPAGTTPSITCSGTIFGCDPQTNGGQSFTLQEQNSVAFGSTNAFTTLALSTPVSVVSGQWIAIGFFTSTQISAAGVGIGQCNSGCGGATNNGQLQDSCINYGSATPTVGNSFNSITGTSQCPQGVSTFLISGGTFSPAVGVTNPNLRWNFNSTCVTISALIQFDYSKGVSGPLGNNCSSADIAVSKAPANLQTAAGRMLEMVTAWENGASTKAQNVTLVLRTNGTLPTFTENYNPFVDTQARLIWTTTFGIQNNGTDSIYVGRDNTKTVLQESLANDLVIQGLSFFNSSNIPFNEQAVLNFTGRTNFLGSFSASSTKTASNNTASGLQFGEDFYILLRANFVTALSPCGGCVVDFVSLQAIPGNGSQPTPISFGIFSTPASCNDPLNQASCSGQGTPVFQFNPLDPSSWGNAIIKGLLWVGTVAIPQGFVLMTSVIATVIQQVGDFIGGHLGWGPIGTNLIMFFSGIAATFGSIGTALGWLPNLVLNSGSMISFAGSLSSTYFPGLTNVLGDLSNGTPQAIRLAGEISVWFPTSYMVIMLFFYFLLVIMNGMKGFFEWIHLVKWSSFSIFNLFGRFLDLLIALITALLGRLSVISPGHQFPKIPHIEPGPVPHIDLHVQDMALFHDPTAWFFGTIGFVFVALFAGTSASGLPAGSVAIISGMGPLFLVLFGTMFMMLILYIPMFILGKLKEHT